MATSLKQSYLKSVWMDLFWKLAGDMAQDSYSESVIGYACSAISSLHPMTGKPQWLQTGLSIE
jgi:hypothetical protein